MTKTMQLNLLKIDYYQKVLERIFKIQDCEVTFSNKYEIADHYGSDIVFIDVKGKNWDGKTNKYHLVVKSGPTDVKIRQHLPIVDAFNAEINVFNQLIPRFHKLQIEKGLELFGSTANCYHATMTGQLEIMIMENLTAKGYTVHNKTSPLDINHIKLVIKAYAEWHALSFALKDQYPNDYLQIAENFRFSAWRKFIQGGFGQILNICQKDFYKWLKEIGEVELLEQHKSKLHNNDVVTVLIRLMEETNKESVILHGDCWNNNFMFRYEGGCPVAVTLLDFQMTSVNSPVIDLSHFIYAVASEHELKHLKELLEFYYEHLSIYLELLHTDIDKVFPKELFRTHWKQYSVHGACMCLGILLFSFVEKDCNVDFTDREKLANEILPKLLKNSEYKNRILQVAKSFLEFEF
ncbi:hypothetical protein ABEB36_002986 [Hypothenemus hampei]|uniref:CHK kinase-like domain-containing protein n=1 Tax=Hypothenemus hampei TaxID=57062 RepID=A0ABD1FAT2_HYPHA